MDALNLSDSDSDAMFDTPAAKKNNKTVQNRGADAADGAAAGKTRGKESHYTTEEAREAALRQELMSVRNVNKVIEGVVESLQKARDNMDVWCMSQSSSLYANRTRRYPEQCTMHPRSYRLGRVSSRKRSTISVLS